MGITLSLCGDRNDTGWFQWFPPGYLAINCSGRVGSRPQIPTGSLGGSGTVYHGIYLRLKIILMLTKAFLCAHLTEVKYNKSRMHAARQGVWESLGQRTSLSTILLRQINLQTNIMWTFRENVSGPTCRRTKMKYHSEFQVSYLMTQNQNKQLMCD